ncbi:MAG TPA: alpha/beta fold hydrolase [Ktedonosporobacter sp.]|nr:alpha/beta fold hydrolase [Ktedonosporobacter sp.]
MSEENDDDYIDPIPYFEPLSDAQPGENKNNALKDLDWREIINSLPIEDEKPSGRGRYALLAVLGAILIIAASSIALFYYLKPSSVATIKLPASTFRYSSTCPFQPGEGIIVGQQLKCGILQVPEDRSSSQTKMIQLAVAIYKSPQTSAPSDPILFLDGGPGAGALDDLGTYLTLKNLDGVALGHDLILLDQRGTGYSKPALSCHELQDLQRNSRLFGSGQNWEQMYLNAVQACHNRLVASGINLNAYTTIDNATDVHDLVHALGYRQVNLDGVSYGTRLALTVMRLFPGDIRSVILDSTVPTQANVFNDTPTVTQHALDVLFAGCSANSHCHMAYPDLQKVFYSLVTALNNNPVTLRAPGSDQPVQLDGDSLLDWVYNGMYVTELIPRLPAIIMQVDHGSYDLIAKYFVPITSNAGINDGMYWSVECGEDMDFTTEQQLAHAANVLHPEINPSVLGGLLVDLDTCKVWNQKPVPVEQKQPVTSSVPTLILSGEYDPITPKTYAEQVKQSLNRSFLFSFPATGHGVLTTNPCPDSIASAFLLNPGISPDASCVASMSEPNFL